MVHLKDYLGDLKELLDANPLIKEDTIHVKNAL